MTTIFTADKQLSYDTDEYQLALQYLFKFHDKQPILGKLNLDGGFYMLFEGDANSNKNMLDVKLFCQGQWLGEQRYTQDSKGKHKLQSTKVSPMLHDEHCMNVTIVTAARTMQGLLKAYYA